MKKFSITVGEKINAVPVATVSKSEIQLEEIKFGILSLMDKLLSIKSYGGVSPVMRIPTKIDGKEMFVEALIDFMQTISSGDKIKLLESLKSDVGDWESIDRKIKTIKTEFIDIKNINKIKSLLEKYGSDKDNFISSIDQNINRIKSRESLHKRYLATQEMINNPIYDKYDKEYLNILSEKYLNKYENKIL